MRGFKEILDGKHDTVPEGNFYMKGGIEEIAQALKGDWRMAETLKLEIVTPQAIVFSEDVHMVTLPAIEGEMGSTAARAPDHPVVPGELIVTKDGQERFLAVGEGLVEVTATTSSIVTDMAIRAEHIDEAKVEEARDRAAGPAEREDLGRGSRLGQRLAVAPLAQLQVKRRQRTRG